MSGAGIGWRAGVLVIAGMLVLGACRRPAEAVKSDLVEAGYQWTVDDWMRAAGADDVEALRRFSAAGFAVDSRDAAGDSALHAAASAGAEKTAGWLLERGLDVNLAGAAGRPPLMAAVLADRAGMVRWLLRQGADSRLKDGEGFNALMLAVREGKVAAVEELAAVQGDGLDSAILLAALVGHAEVIDTLTSFGASVHARMDDGRTTLMVAAEHGHAEAVKLLLDIGASRFSTDGQGRTAADLAMAGGHAEVVALISREPQPDELVLETEEEMAAQMAAAIDQETVAAEGVAASSAIAGELKGEGGETPVGMPVGIDGQVLGQGTAVPAQGAAGAPTAQAAAGTSPVEVLDPGVSAPGAEEARGVAASDAGKGSSGQASGGALPGLPPLVMRQYRQRELPVRVREVGQDGATIEVLGAPSRTAVVAAGQPVPGSRLVVVRVERRMVSSKENLGQAAEVSVVEVRDPVTGITREWIAGQELSAHDPVALIEDQSTGRRYLGRAGGRFRSADGREFVISDVRPDQIVVEDAVTGTVQTLPLRGPRG